MLGYIARDKNGELYLHKNFPQYQDEYEGWFSDTFCLLNVTNEFTEFEDLKYTDEPVAVEINIRKI